MLYQLNALLIHPVRMSLRKEPEPGAAGVSGVSVPVLPPGSVLPEP